LPSIYIGLNVKYPLMLPDFTWTIIFSKGFQKVPIYQSSWKSIQFETKLFHLDRRTNRQTGRYDKAISCFSNFPDSNCCPSVHVDNHTTITPTKCTLLLLKAPDITICTLCLIFCSYMFQPMWVIFRGLNASAWLKLLLITIY
jgi:hypothetical protein